MKAGVLPVAILSYGIAALLSFEQAGASTADANDPSASPPAVGVTTTPARQRAALAELAAAHPQARLYYSGDQATRIYGAPLSLGETPLQAAEQFRTNHAEALGVAPAELLPATPILDSGNTLPLMYDSETGQYRFTLVYYSHYRDGVPVFRSEMRVLVRNEPGNPVVWVGSSLRPLGDFHPTAPRAAVSLDTTAWTGATGLTTFTEPQQVIWAGTEGIAAEPTEAVTFVGDNFGDPIADPPEKWLFVVDAHSGAILYQENKIVFTDVNGSVRGMATQGYKADYCSPEVSTPMPYAQAAIGSTVVYGDVNGSYTVPNSGSSSVTVISPMSGLYFVVDDKAGPLDNQTKVVTPPGPANFVHNQANTSEWLRSEVNSYIQANIVRDWLLKYNPSYPTISAQTFFPVRVNRADGYCPGNAWYSGDGINFCRSSSRWPNTGYSSVVYHEYGHHIVEKGGSGQDQYGEGMSDCVASLIADEPTMAWGFEGDCNSGLRTAANNYQYPCSGESHDCGNLLSGCVWSTRNELFADFPATYRDIIAALTVNSVPLHAGELITPQITIDFLTLDDDDATLDNGTPHGRAICAGFGAHNMNCPVGVVDPLAFQYPDGRPVDMPTDQEKTFSVVVVSTETGVNPVPGSGRLVYTVDGVNWTFQTMNQTAPNEYQAVLPATPCRQQVLWYVTAQADDLQTYTDPKTASVDPNMTLAGRRMSVSRSDNFENPAGWTVGDAGDDATTGVWELAAPQATIAQPGADHTPFPWTKCWITGAAAGATPNANDVNGGKTTLMSPTLNLSSVFEPTISYWRWYSNSMGPSPNSNVFTVDISNDNGATWTNVETVGPSGPGTSGGWVRHVFRVADILPPTATVKMRFVASEYGADALVEAAIDDFEVATYQCDIVPPTPNPPTWVVVPTPISTTAITMQAHAEDPLGVEYYISVTGISGHQRTWNADPSYTDTGLDVNRNLSYKAKARDGALPTPNETAYNAPISVATFIETPTGLAFGAITDNSIAVTALDTFTRLEANQSGLYFEVLDHLGNPVGGPDANAWVQVQSVTAVGLAPGATYRFRVKARNYYAQNETPWYPATDYLPKTTTGVLTCTPCADIDQDQDVDYDDYAAMRVAIGHSVGQPGVSPCADLDHDGLVTFVDFQMWVECYRAYSGDPFAPLPAPPARGDANGDGVINAADIQAFVAVLCNPGTASPAQRSACDINADGTVGVKDASEFVDLLLSR